MEQIKNIIDVFLEPYLKDENIQAIFLTGSYALENQNTHSDIDIFMISSNKSNWKERGNKIVLNYLIEYFISPLEIIWQELNTNKITETALMIINGKEIFDKSGILKELKQKTLDIINNPILPENDPIDVERNKYWTYYYHKQLGRALEKKSNEFTFLYYTFLEHIIYSYGRYNKLTLPRRTKIYQYIFNEEYYMNKYLKKIDDKIFLEMVKKCMENNGNEIMYKDITQLKNYLLNHMGGFNIDGWVIKT